MSGARWAGRLFFRMLREGDFTLLIAALVLSTGVMTTAVRFNGQAEQTINASAAALMGGDLVVNGHQPMDPAWKTRAEELGLQSAEVAEFPSMLIEKEALLLVSVRAIPQGYPFKGHIERIDATGQAASTETGGPRPGEVWAEPEVLSALGVTLGDTLTVGDKTLRLSHSLTEDPARRGTLESLSPRILIHSDNLSDTHVIGPGSHLAYQAVFAGPRDAIKSMQRWLATRLASGQTLTDLEDNPPNLGRGLTLVRHFIALTATLMTLLAATAIGLSARSYALRCRDLVALLRCHGLSLRGIHGFFLLQGIFLAVPSALLGIGLATLLGSGLRGFLPVSLTEQPPVDLDWGVVGLALTLGPLLLVGFAFSPLSLVAKTPPTQVLHRSNPETWSASVKPFLGAVVVLILLQALASGDLSLSLKLSVLSGLCLAVLAIAGRGFLKFSRPIRMKFPVIFRLGLARLIQQPRETFIQLIGFSIPLACLTLVASFEQDLLKDIQAEIPRDAPTHFILNLFDTDLDGFNATTRSLGIVSQPLYPIVRGRLTAINESSALDRSKGDSRAAGAINRDLALTFSKELPLDNQVTEGLFNPSAEQHEVSMEQDLADRLGVHVGDRLTFEIQGESLTVSVSSLRSVRWRRMTPNFYFIFSKGVIDHFPRTWMTSLKIAQGSSETARTLSSDFPSSSLIDLSRALAQLQALAEKITGVARPILWLCLISTLLVLLATAESKAPERRRDATLLSLLGIRRAGLVAIGLAEFLGLGVMSGVMGVALAEGIRFWLYHQMLDLPFISPVERWLVIPLGFALCVALIGLITTRRQRSSAALC